MVISGKRETWSYQEKS